MILENISYDTVETGRIELQTCTDVDSFSRLENEWDLLSAKCSDSTIFNSWPWLYSWWQTYGAVAGKELHILVWRNSRAELVGIAPLYLVKEKIKSGFDCCFIKFVGDGSYDSDYLNLIIHPDYFKQIISGFLNWINTNKEWDCIELNTIPQLTKTVNELIKALSTTNYWLRLNEQICATTSLPGSFDEFFKKLRPRFRTKIRKVLRRFDSDLDYVFEYDNQNLEIRLASLFQLHNLRWNARGQAGVFENPLKQKFYYAFVNRFSHKGWLRFYSLKYKGLYVAHQLCFSNSRNILLLQEGFDISEDKLSYGQMLRSVVFRHLIESGEKVYDFLGGFSSHKSDWGAKSSNMIQIQIARKNIRGTYYFKLPIWRENIVTCVKKIIPRILLKHFIIHN